MSVMPCVPYKEPTSTIGRLVRRIQVFLFGADYRFGAEYKLDKDTTKVVDMVLSSWNSYSNGLRRTGVDLENFGVYEEKLKHYLGAYLRIERPILGTLTRLSPVAVKEFVTTVVLRYLMCDMADPAQRKEYIPETQDSETLDRFIDKYLELKAMSVGKD